MKVFKDALHRFAWGTDASFYRFTPQEVVIAETEEDVVSTIKRAAADKRAVTFRAAGTSLSGQAVSDSILLVAGKGWERYSIGKDSITMQPGILGGKVNRILAPVGRRFGPDPASIESCMVGGIVANNASGMSCGIHANSDREIQSARIVLADGTVLDTGSEESRAAFRKSHAAFIGTLMAIREDVLANKVLTERIRRKYSIKNVTGLNLLPLITFEDPFDIITHLMVGSEGTLAFLSEVTMHTLPLEPFKASAMIYFPDIREAAEGVLCIKDAQVNAAEVLDRRSLLAMEDSGLLSDELKAMLHSGRDITAVLVEVTAGDEAALQEKADGVKKALATRETVVPFDFTRDPEVYGRYWALRSGVFPAVGGLRKPGTTCLIEDIAFHIEDLPQATSDLSALLDRHGYEDSCIYGHALAGNFHFIINQSFDTAADVRRYEAMISDVVSMVVDKYDGSLKAEHGTGRNMAPFVQREWGADAFAVMNRIKALFDPQGILNPGVIFNDDPECFIKGFKAMPQLGLGYDKADKCIECGFCEHNCMSCGFTLSARTRIAVLREIRRLRLAGENALADKLECEYRYPGNVTCAGDGLCSTSCPMGINVSELTHLIRERDMSSVGRAAGTFAAEHFHGVKNGVRLALDAARLGQNVIGTRAMSGLCKGLHSAGIPLWTPSTPKSYRVKAAGQTPSPLRVVYIPSCINQAMGLPKNAGVSRPLVEETCALLEKAGYEVIFPQHMDSLCCGTIWESKGMPEVAERKLREMDDALWEASEHGRWPVLCDQSPCLHRMRKGISRMELYEPVEFIWKFLRDKLSFTKVNRPVPIHLTCSTRLMHLEKTFVGLARMCSDNVFVPEDVLCCGFAGDKGFTVPELNAWGLRHLAGQVEGCTMGYSNSRTCEIGLSTHSHIPYVSIVYLVNECTSSR